MSGVVGFGAVAESIVARVVLVSGDRQISLGQAPATPIGFRAIDAEGRPVAGAVMLIGVVGYDGPWRVDEFGFRGFNAPNFARYLDPLTMPGGYYFKTNENGEAEGQSAFTDAAPSAFLFGAGGWPGTAAGPQAFASVVRVVSPPPGNPTVVVEYFHSQVQHYFITHLQNEIDALESGKFDGWKRSVGAFVAYARAQDSPPGSVPVCRLFSERYTSHFYAADRDECEAVVSRWPGVWMLETTEAFYINVPDRSTGTCSAGFQPVYRLYIERNGPNHRYVTDRILRGLLIARGWTSEGYGPDGVVYCTPM